jgi:hypothetical protein
MMSKHSITASPIERDEYGYWTHPGYLALLSGSEQIEPEEFKAWCEESGIVESAVLALEDDTDTQAEERYFDQGDPDISQWNPEPPKGTGWFLGSIHDTEDGPVSIWFRTEQDDEL